MELGSLRGSQLLLAHRPVGFRWYENMNLALRLGGMQRGWLSEKKELCTPTMLVDFFFFP